MPTFIHQLELLPANDVSVGRETCSLSQASLRAEHRLMLVIAFLIGAVLVSSIADGCIMAEALPDLTTFAGRV